MILHPSQFDFGRPFNYIADLFEATQMAPAAAEASEPIQRAGEYWSSPGHLPRATLLRSFSANTL
jgi:hypothetical protein